MIIDAHQHMFPGIPGKNYFPWQQGWFMAMFRAYQGKPPYDFDPKRRFGAHEGRMSDPEGTYTLSSMDEGGVDAAVLLPIDYDYA